MAYRETEIPVQICHGCGHREGEGMNICPQCGAPMDVGEYAELALKLEPAIRSARWNLLVVITLNLLLVGALVAVRRPSEEVIGQLVLVLLYVGCLSLGFFRPYAGALLALCLFVGCEIAATVVYPVRMFPSLSLLIRVALGYALFRGVRSGFRARDLRARAGRHDRKILAGALVLTVLAGVALGVGVRLADGNADADADADAATALHQQSPNG